MIRAQIIVPARSETISSRDDLIKEELFIMIKTGAFVLPRTHQTLNWQSASEQAPELDLKGFTTALTDGDFSHGERRLQYLNYHIAGNYFLVHCRQLELMFRKNKPRICVQRSFPQPSQLPPGSSLGTLWVSGCILATRRSLLPLSSLSFAKALRPWGCHSSLGL